VAGPKFLVLLVKLRRIGKWYGRGRENGNEPPVPLRDNFRILFNRPLIGPCYPERAPALELLPARCRCTAKEARFLPWGRASFILFV
jgi:hypothetical protein